MEAIAAALETHDVPALLASLTAVLGCEVRAILLYGSRARGEETVESDWDLLVLTDRLCSSDLRRRVGGVDLDIDVRPTDAVEEGMVYLLPGRVLHDPFGDLERLLSLLVVRAARGPDPLAEAETARWHAWVERMLRRISAGLEEDRPLAAYQMSWLHQELLLLYFTLRRRWTMGPKAALRWLRENEPALYDAYAAFAEATVGEARVAALRRIAERTLAD
jgi:hypothetical protein